MKKTIIIIFLFLFSIAMHPQSIQVTTPDALDYWNIGETYEIEWNVTGEMDPTVKINIFRNSIDQANFIQQLTGPNTGKMNWTIPGNFTEGVYVLRIKTSDNQVVGDSALFHVQDRRLISINLISPATGGRYITPGSMQFSWEMESGHLVEHVRIIVKKGGQTLEGLVTGNDGSETLPLTDNINDGTDYSVRIEDADDPSIFDESGYFEIYHQSSPKINVLKPAKSNYGLGEAMAIQWESSGFDSNVNIDLLKDGSMFRNLVPSLTDHSFNWQINNIQPGDYQVRVSAASNSNISGLSRVFFIGLSADLLVFSRNGIFERETVTKGQNLTLRFRVLNPSAQSIPVILQVRFFKGRISRLPGITTKKPLRALASTRYNGSPNATVNGNGETPFDLPVTINDGYGDHTVIITVLPAGSSDTVDPVPGNNTIYGYYKVYLKALSQKKIK